MKWKVIVTWFRDHEYPQEIKEPYEIEAPTAADALTICNLRYNLPWKGQDGTYDQGSTKKITDIEWIPVRHIVHRRRYSSAIQ